MVRRMIPNFLLDQARLKAEHADSGAVTLLQRFSCADDLSSHLQCLVLDGVVLNGVRRRTDGESRRSLR